MMAEIGLTKRVKFAGDVHAELLKAGWDLETATLFVNNIPDADVVPVVRCKDCKHRRDYGDIARGYYCAKHPSNCGRLCKDNDFCSYGERKDVEW